MAKSKPFNNPFDKIKLDKPAPVAARKEPLRSPPPSALPETEEDEAELFRQMVGEVVPVRRRLLPPTEPPSAAALRNVSAEVEAMTQLCELVAGSGPIDVAQSDQRIEGSAPGLDEQILHRLRNGDYSIQAELDLHGMVRTEAKEALDRFISDARLKGHRCVCVVTGRGLHSEDQIPVLKEGVQTWLTRGRTGRQVLAFTSARREDGGAGAVYVLLRR